MTARRKHNTIVIFLLVILGISIASLHIVTSGPQEYTGPESCKKCHAENYEEWEKSKHATAYSDLVASKAFQENGAPFCFMCHTTGYDPATQTYVFEGVTCELCHGPGQTMRVNKEVCAQCHTGTHHPTADEFSLSKHYEKGMTCDTCHDVHAAEPKNPENPSETCIQCHAEEAAEEGESTHGIHNVACIDCHVFEREYFSENVPAITGHTFEPLGCLKCHTEDLHGSKEIIELEEEVSSLQSDKTQLESRVSELSTTLEKMSMYKTTTYLLIVVVAILAIVSALGLKKK